MLFLLQPTQATILEEMPQFPEKDSLLLSKLYKSAPWMAKLHESKEETPSASSSGETAKPTQKQEPQAPAAPIAAPISSSSSSTSAAGDLGTVDLLGIGIEPSQPVPIYGNLKCVLVKDTSFTVFALTYIYHITCFNMHIP